MKKLLTLTTILACASCLGAYASSENPGGGGTLSFGGFYGVALQDLYSDVDKIDIYGVKLAYDFPAIIDEGNTSMTLFVEAMYGYGDDSENDRYYGSTDFTLMHWDFAVGPRLRFQLTEIFALSMNAKVGVDVEYLCIDPDYGPKSDDAAVGFLWGAGVAAEFQASKHWGFFVGLDYTGSTTKPDLHHYNEPDQQSYLLISVGATVRF